MSSPTAIGIIMDGNRRWARERELPTLEGHRAGSTKINDLLHWAQARGIQEVTVYAFSTENWNRSPEEVKYLMDLFENMFEENLDSFIKEGGRVRFIGERTRLPKRIQKRMDEAERRSAKGEKGTLIIALSYGGRAEIVAAANTLLAAGCKKTDEDGLRKAMWSAGLRDPDLIIRTGGEKRLSNFLSWQSAYSELFFTDTKWPDFSEEEFDAILADFASRERRHGT